MNGNVIEVEQLDNGLRAAFVHMPHFRTTSVRLAINSGSMHESADTAGAAHFLEHVTFQGTEELPSEKEIHDFSEKEGIYKNAFTSQTHTVYAADGYTLPSVGFVATQLALHPLLTPAALERERKPISDEMRAVISNPNYTPNYTHMRAIFGDLYARPIGGSLADVQKITHENLVDYYEKNYKLANALLVICSKENVDTQREYAHSIVDEIDESHSVSTKIALTKFNPFELLTSLAEIELPSDAQTSIDLNYGLPEQCTNYDEFRRIVLISALGKMAHRRLRSELAICYAASSGSAITTDQNYGNNKDWSHMWVKANLAGEDSLHALDALVDDVIRKDIPQTALDSVLLSISRSIEHILQGNPMSTADFVINALNSSKRDFIDLEEGQKFAERLTLNEIQKFKNEITQPAPLITVTSPESKILEDISGWAADRY